MMTKRIGVAVFLVAGAAHADENVCKDAYEQSQVLMKPNPDKSSLLPAREMLRTCMRSGCKDWMVSDCSKWLGEVDQRIPTVVFSAKNTAGRDLFDLKVTRDGADITAKLDGRAIELEPGMQTFVFTLPDGTQKEKAALVREGEKAQNISALFDAPPDEMPVNPNGFQPLQPLPEKQPSTLRYVGYASAGIGAVGLGLGAIFGITAISKKNEASCDASGACDSLPLDNARDAAGVSTISFIAGGALLATGIVLLLTSSSRH